MELTGIRLDAEGDLQIDVRRDVFAKMAENIMQGIAEGDVKTRSVNKVGSPRFLALRGSTTTGFPTPSTRRCTSSVLRRLSSFLE
jgi:hypothetical protein